MYTTLFACRTYHSGRRNVGKARNHIFYIILFLVATVLRQP